MLKTYIVSFLCKCAGGTKFIILNFQGALFLFFAGRLEEIKGNIREVELKSITISRWHLDVIWSIQIWKAYFLSLLTWYFVLGRRSFVLKSASMCSQNGNSSTTSVTGNSCGAMREHSAIFYCLICYVCIGITTTAYSAVRTACIYVWMIRAYVLLISFRQDWLLAMKYAEILCNESRWSRATYSYQKACFFMMCDEQTEATKEHINSLMTYVRYNMMMMIVMMNVYRWHHFALVLIVHYFRDVPTFKQRIAGKSIPIEKFTVKKCRRYFEQNGYLTLPSYVSILLIAHKFETAGNFTR